MFQWSDFVQRYWMQDARNNIQVEKDVFERTPMSDRQNFDYWLVRGHWKGVEVEEVAPVLDFHRRIDLDLEWDIS